MRKELKVIVAAIMASFITSCDNNTYVTDSNNDTSPKIQQTLPNESAEEHKMLVIADGEYLYDLESGDLFYGYNICKEYSLNDGDVLNINCIIENGWNELQGNTSDIIDVLSCERTSLSSADIRGDESVESSTVYLENDGLIDRSDPSDGNRTVVFYVSDNCVGAISDTWEGVRLFDNIVEINTDEENTALVCTKNAPTDEAVIAALKSGNILENENILFVGYKNDPLELMCEAAYFTDVQTEFEENAEYVFEVNDDTDERAAELEKNGIPREIISKIFNMDIYDSTTVYVFCGKYSIDPRHPIVIDCNNRLAPSKGEEKADIIVVAVDNRIFNSVSR